MQAAHSSDHESSSNLPATETANTSKGKRKSADHAQSEHSLESTSDSAPARPKSKRARMDPFEASGVQDETLQDTSVNASTETIEAPKSKKRSKKNKAKAGSSE